MTRFVKNSINIALDLFFHSSASKDQYWEFIENSGQIRVPNPAFRAPARPLSLTIFLTQVVLGLIAVISFGIQIVDKLDPVRVQNILKSSGSDWLKAEFFHAMFLVQFILFITYYRLYYVVRFTKFDLGIVARELHHSSEVVRQLQDYLLNRSADLDNGELRLQVKKLHEHLLAVCRNLFKFDPNIELVFKVRKGSYFYRLTDANAFLDKPIKDYISTEQDYCFNFMQHLSFVKQKPRSKRTVILIGMRGLFTPANFIRAFHAKKESPFRAAMLALEADPTQYWRELHRRMNERQYQSLIRLNVSDPTTHAHGTVLVASKAPFTFYRCPEEFVDLLLSAIDQMAYIFKEYGRCLED